MFQNILEVLIIDHFLLFPFPQMLSSGAEGTVLNNPSRALSLAPQPPQQDHVRSSILELFDFNLLEREEGEGEGGEEEGRGVGVGGKSFLGAEEEEKKEEKEKEEEKKQRSEEEELIYSKITSFGKLCASLPLSFELCRLVVLGGMGGRMVIHAVVMAVGVGIELFIRPFPFTGFFSSPFLCIVNFLFLFFSILSPTPPPIDDLIKYYNDLEATQLGREVLAGKDWSDLLMVLRVFYLSIIGNKGDVKVTKG